MICSVEWGGSASALLMALKPPRLYSAEANSTPLVYGNNSSCWKMLGALLRTVLLLGGAASDRKSLWLMYSSAYKRPEKVASPSTIDLAANRLSPAFGSFGS